MRELLARHVLFEVVGEHPSPGAAAPGAVLRLVVEEQHVAGSRFHHARGDLAAMHAPSFLGAIKTRPRRHVVEGVAEGITVVATSRDNTQTTAVRADRVEVEGDLQRAEGDIDGTVRMPVRIAAIIIAVAVPILVGFPQEPGGEACDTLVIQQGTEIFAVIDTGAHAEPLLAIVVIASASQ